jgi:hypothetical protein
MSAVGGLFVDTDGYTEEALKYWNVGEYGSPAQLTDFLFDLGIRA